MNEKDLRYLQDKFMKRKIHGVLTRKWDRQYGNKIQYKKERRWK